MAEFKEEHISKPHIETLSDLIFGLALSIGALTLIGQPAEEFGQLLQFMLYYAFSFTILISVWYGYTRNMTLLRIEKSSLIVVNILLLFLVSIEPFLFNQLFGHEALFVENVSVLYALDLGGLFLIQAILANAVLSDKSRPKSVLYDYKLRRVTLLISSSLFFVSIVPIFWSSNIAIASGVGIPFRVILWLIPLLLPNIRRLWQKLNKSKSEET